MRLFILTDAEGAAGFVNYHDYSSPEGRYYERARELVTLEVNAAIEGALEAGVTSVHVVDAHGPGCLNLELLHPEATLLTGTNLRQPFGINASYDLAFMTGHHAKANTDGGFLCHSFSTAWDEMWINGHSIGEIGTWLTVFGHLGIPMPLLTGDQAACDEIEGYTPGVRTVATKVGQKAGSSLGMTVDANRAHNGAATHMHPTKARAMIRDAAARAVGERDHVSFWTLEPPYEIVTVQRPVNVGDPHHISICHAAKAEDIMRVPREWDGLQEDLPDLVKRMEETGQPWATPVG